VTGRLIINMHKNQCKGEKNESKLKLLETKFDENNLPPNMSVKNWRDEKKRLRNNLKK